MIGLYALVAIYIAWIWVDYYRLIDIYDRDKLINFVAAFAIGFLSIPLTLFLSSVLVEDFGFGLKGEFVNDFLYTFLGIGAIEEFSKLVAFLVFGAFFHRIITEPIDVVAYYCTVALGFAAIENVLYFQRHGADIIFARAILSTVGHMFDGALVAYGYVLFKYKFEGRHIWVLPVFFILGSLAHGIYDFLLMYEFLPFKLVLFFLYFMLTISLFAVVLNNSLNHSVFFSYSMVINSDKVFSRLLTSYGILLLVELLLLILTKDIYPAILQILFTISTTGFIVFVAAARLSRFKLIDDRWHPLRFELPFGLVEAQGRNGAVSRLAIKGDSYNQAHMNQYYHKYFEIWTLGLGRFQAWPEERKLGFLERKLFLKNDETHFVIRVFDKGVDSPYKTYVLKPKLGRGNRIDDEHPVHALLTLDPMPEEVSYTGKIETHFHAWVFVKPAEI